MGESEPASLRYRFEWSAFEFHPSKCPSQKSRLPRVVIEPAVGEELIQFPQDSARAKRITMGLFPNSSLGGERVPDKWFGIDTRTWKWPNARNTPEEFQPHGFYWLDIEFTNRYRYMGWLHTTQSLAMGTGLDNYLEVFSDNLKYVVELRKHAFKLADHETKKKSAAYAFARFLIQNPCPTSTARAYLVDWALAERRTGLSFESMEAFEEWAAQQGLTVMGVVDAASASESEGEE